MSKSTNTVVYFDWKTVIYIYVCGKCGPQFMQSMEKSVTFTGACGNEIIPNGELARLLTKRKKEEVLEYCTFKRGNNLNFTTINSQHELSRFVIFHPRGVHYCSD